MYVIVWNAICKIIPLPKVNSLCQMSIFIHVASKNVCAMPKSIYNMGQCICQMLNFIYVMCKFMYGLRYSCSVVYTTCPDPFCYVAYLKPFMLCLEILLFASIHLYCWQKQHSLCQFLLRPSLLCCICKIIHSCSRLYVAFAKLYVALAESPLDLW